MDHDRHERWKSFKTLIATSDLPELGPRPRSSRFPLPELTGKLDSFLAQAPLPPEAESLLRSVALLWHDHLDASHEISQVIHSSDGGLLHGIMHRREPDYSNARYWFHRAGNHSCFGSIAKKTAEHLHSEGEDTLVKKLASHGAWNPFAFVDACEEAAGLPPGHKLRRILQRIQEIELDALLAHLFARTWLAIR
jgi:hypothetical protein